MWTPKDVKIIEDFQNLISSDICDTFHLTEQGEGCSDCPFCALCDITCVNLARTLEERVPDLMYENKIYQEESEG